MNSSPEKNKIQSDNDTSKCVSCKYCVIDNRVVCKIEKGEIYVKCHLKNTYKFGESYCNKYEGATNEYA